MSWGFVPGTPSGIGWSIAAKWSIQNCGNRPSATLNIGTIQGGTATNIVPDSCTCEGEIRSYSHKKALEQEALLRQLFQSAAEEAGADFRMESSIDLTAYETDASASAVKRFERACRNLGLSGTLTRTFGGSDNNHFARQGISE